jgi:hypothetical protein
MSGFLRSREPWARSRRAKWRGKRLGFFENRVYARAVLDTETIRAILIKD